MENKLKEEKDKPLQITDFHGTIQEMQTLSHER